MAQNLCFASPQTTVLDNVAAANYQEQENAISFLASTQYSNRSMQYCTS